MLGATVDGWLVWLLTAFVAYRLAKVGWLACKAVYKFWLVRRLGWNVDLAHTKYADAWTVVTGCTDGIGRAYTLQLAKRGCRKFLLIGRNPTKLAAVAKSLKSLGATAVEQHVFDFASDDWDKLPQLQSYKIGILVNCAGLGVDDVAKWTEYPAGLAAKVVRVNAEAAIQLIDVVLRGMVERDDGIIVNVASIQGWRPMSHLLSYPASKACLTFVSEALRDEYGGTNVKIQCLVPILVATKMIFMGASEADGYLLVDPDEYARQAVDIIGLPGVCTGCVQHELQAMALTFVPFWLARPLLAPFYAYQGRRVRAARHNYE